MKLRHAVVAVLLLLALCFGLADGQTKKKFKGFDFKSSKGGRDSATKENSKGKLKALLSRDVKLAASLFANKTGGIGIDKDIGDFGKDEENDKKEDDNMIMEGDNGGKMSFYLKQDVSLRQV